MRKLSIITVNYNNLEGLKKTFKSVFEQSYQDFEYIVIDGGSIDGSKQLILDNSDKLTYWSSETDKGIYNAMNKGLQKAFGDYCLFLNSGDFLSSKNSLNILVNNSSNGEDIIYGNFILEYPQSNLEVKKYPSNLSFTYLIENSLPHQATLIKTEILKACGGYNEDFTIISDWVFFVEAIIIRKCSYKHIDENITIFNMDGLSCKLSSVETIKKEKDIFFKTKFYGIVEDFEKLILIKKRFELLKNSRLRKFLSVFLPQLKI